MSTITKETQSINESKELETSARSEALAQRIEEGAEGLAAFVEDLSEAEWSIPVSPTRTPATISARRGSHVGDSPDERKRFTTLTSP